MTTTSNSGQAPASTDGGGSEFDPSAQALLSMVAQPGVPPLNALPVAQAREAYAQAAPLSGEPGPVARTEDASADGVSVKLYWPDGEGPHPVLIWIHGGGWTVGSAGESDTVARELCRQVGCLVVNVDYRLAPENPFPAAVHDVVTVGRWVQATISSRGGDPSRIAVGGDSAGGNLSAVLGQELPGVFALQVLVYPAVDLTMSHASIDTYGEGQLLTKEAMIWFTDHYLQGHDPRDPQASPLFADQARLAASPPTLMITGDCDPLRDENLEYAARLHAAGVEVEHLRYPGQIHAFYMMAAVIPAGREAIERTAEALRQAFG